MSTTWYQVISRIKSLGFQSSIGALKEQRTIGFKRGSVNHSLGPKRSMTCGHHPSPAKDRWDIMNNPLFHASTGRLLKIICSLKTFLFLHTDNVMAAIFRVTAPLADLSDSPLAHKAS